MRRLAALLGLSFALNAAPAAAGPVDIGVGIERFNWQEFDISGAKMVKESGPRLFVSLESENQVSERWIYGFRGRIYAGTVTYDGQLIGSGTPYSTDSDYSGFSGAVDFTGRFPRANGEFSDWGLRFGLGGDSWNRHLQDGVSGGTVVAGYTEKYTALVGRLGVAYVPVQGWFGEAGAKYPFKVREEVNLYDGVTLEPQGAISLFGTIGYNFGQRWSIKGYYDSYRFKASNAKDVTSGGVPAGTVYQPRSDMDLLGITAGFFF